MGNLSSQEIETLWEEFTVNTTRKASSLDLANLQAALKQHGLDLGNDQLKNIFGLQNDSEYVTHRQFRAVMVSLLGDRHTRVKHAFGFLDEKRKGVIAIDDFLRVAKAFAGDDKRCELIAAELDSNGDQLITEEDFLKFLPEDYQPPVSTYHSTHLPPLEHRDVAGGSGNPSSDTETSKSEISSHNIQTHLKEVTGTSPLQLRISFFRLLQGAAYRSFRENYSANSETHLKARDLPYTITDFARFVSVTVDFYLGLGVVEAGCDQEFRKLETMVQRELQALKHRIAKWHDIEKTPAMLAAQATIEEERGDLEEHRHLFMAVIEYVLSLHGNAMTLEHLAEDLLAKHEINRLRHQELEHELVDKPHHATDMKSRQEYLESWNRVILDSSDEKVDGAIMPVRFWYAEFMPQLLRCCSINTVAELEALATESERDLDSWFESVIKTGVLDQFGKDLRDGFSNCSRDVKQALKQAWTLTELYLNGVQKRREREEMGRSSGFLSEYVAFVDCYLGRNDVEIAEMRLSFPYYIGPAVWRLLHTSAEIIEAMPADARRNAINRFKTFFASFATMYPCPYCRYHLNRYVVQNREVGMYPVEYLFLGQRPQANDLHVSINDKLESIHPEQPGSLRLFLWKLHNTVSSSIARTEPWYHRDPKPHYTTRYWPSMDSELARAHALGQLSLELDRMVGIYGILKPAARLSVLRDELQSALHNHDQNEVDRLFARAQDIIADLEAEVIASGYLQKHYHFDPTLVNKPPHFTEEEEAFARSGLYAEN